ncbi:MAG: C2 family cysteine protease [Phycisphaerae bacterium]
MSSIRGFARYKRWPARSIALAALALGGADVASAFSVTLIGDGLLIEGSNDMFTPDEIEIYIDGADVVVKPTGSATGTAHRFPVASVARITVMLLDGSDLLYAPDVPIPMAVNAGSGDDVIWTGSAADFVVGEHGEDHIYLGAGNDEAYGFFKIDYTLILTGYDDPDEIDGGPGNDTLYGGPDADVLRGGEGTATGFDVLYGYYPVPDTYDVSFDGKDELYGGTGKNKIWGGPSDDTIVGGDSYDLLYGQAGNDTITGKRFPDRIWGHAGIDIINGGSGDDTISGGSEPDLILGEMGRDVINGGSGGDEIDSGNDNDQVTGGTGDDIILTGSGDDTVDAGADDDDVTTGSGNDIVFAGSGDDYVDLGYGDDFANGQADRDIIIGHFGNDTIFGGAGNDNLSGGQDNDYLDGESGADTIDGGADDDTLIGGVADVEATDHDTLTGGPDSDTIYGGPGIDVLDGGDGVDLLVAIDGMNDDTLIGGSGFDSFWSDDRSVAAPIPIPNLETPADLSAAEEETNVHYVDGFDNIADFSWDGDPIADPDADLEVEDESGDVTRPFDRFERFDNLPLFSSKGPAYTDVIQRHLGDCWLLAALAATANASGGANALRQMVLPLPDGTFVVQLGTTRLTALFGDDVHFYRVDTDLPVDAIGQLMFAQLGAEDSLWVALIEKAVALDESGWGPIMTYDAADGGRPGRAFRYAGAEGQLTGILLAELAPAGWVAEVMGAGHDAGFAVAISSVDPPTTLPVGNHAYMLLDVNPAGDRVQLYNPWGRDGYDTQPADDTNAADGIIEVDADDLERDISFPFYAGISYADFSIFNE